jgi:hypothetical protein
VSKSDHALAAAQEVREQAFLTGRPAVELVAEIAPEWDVEPHVVKSWVLRDPNFESLDMLDKAVIAAHNEVAENEARRAQRARQREVKFQELGEIIDSIPQKAVWWAMLNVVGSSTSQSWRTWIEENFREPQAERDDAFAFANARLRERLAIEKLNHAPNH